MKGRKAPAVDGAQHKGSLHLSRLRNSSMRLVKAFTCLAVLTALAAGCSSPQDRAAKAQEQSYEAQEEVARQRLDLVGTYQAGVDEAAGDQHKGEACDSYLRAAQPHK